MLAQPRRAIARAVVIALPLGAAACTLLVPAKETQCSTTADCAAHGAAFAEAVCVDHVCIAPTKPLSTSPDANTDEIPDAGAPDTGPWGCLDETPVAVNPQATVDVEIHAIDALKPLSNGGATGGTDLTVDGTPLAGVHVLACNVLDPSCATPVTPDVVTDANGFAHLMVAGNFSGFYQLRRSDLIPTTVYPGKLLAGETKAPTPAPLLAQNGVALLAGAIGVPFVNDPDAGVGHLFLNVFDCLDHHAAGVAFAISTNGPQTTGFYTKGGLPNTTTDRTDALGAGGAVNVPIGVATISATLADTKRALGSINVVIRSGEATLGLIRPRVR